MQGGNMAEGAPRFGNLAVQMGFITREQLIEALTEQVDDDLDRKPHRTLGAILIARGWMTVRQVDTVLDRIVEYLRSQGKFD
jgi:hypothetical protein